ncbi:MAG: hypothetical protein ABJI60_00790 [Kangiellaceae bacterium]
MKFPKILLFREYSYSSLLFIFLVLTSIGCGGGGNESSVAEPSDSTPNQFSFTPQTDVALDSEIISESITINGIDVVTSISITGGDYSIDDGAFITEPATLTNGQSVRLKLKSSPLNSITTEAILSVGGISGSFTATTLDDLTPNVFTFVDVVESALGVQVLSNEILVSGVSAETSIEIEGGEYSIDGGDFVSDEGAIEEGQSVIVRVESASAFSTAREAVLTIGDVSGVFSVTTLDDLVPDTFTFIDQVDVPLNSLIESNQITVTGISAPTIVSITGGEYSIDGMEYAGTEGLVNEGQTLIVRLTSASDALGIQNVTLTIGGVSDTFSVTTEIDTTPDEFTFIAKLGVDITTLTESNEIVVEGINAPTEISISNGEYSIDGGDFTQLDGTVTNQQTVVARLTSSESPATTDSAVLTIGGVSSTFEVTTMDIDFSVSLLDIENNPTSYITRKNPGFLEAKLTIGNASAIGVPITFSLNNEFGEFDSNSNTILTDENGIARIRLLSGATAGDGVVSGTIEGDITRSVDFSTGFPTVSLEMNEPTLTPSNISWHGSAIIEATILETPQGGSTAPVREIVAFEITSDCIEQGKASIESDFLTKDGVARAIYHDQGCAAADTIQISAVLDQTVLNKTVGLQAQSALVGSISYQESSATHIALKGSGAIDRPEESTLTFTINDSNGNPVQNAGVNFSLQTEIGGITLEPDTVEGGAALTDELGQVEVTIKSGDTATSVRVIASLESNPSVASVSDEIIISSIVANSYFFKLSASSFAPEGWSINGVESIITATVLDRFEYPVPDGTNISFITEFGSIIPSCTTVDGECSVVWSSGSPRVPFPEFREETTVIRKIGDIQVSECLRNDQTQTNLNAASLPCFYENARESSMSEPKFFGGLGQVYGNRVTIRASVIGEEAFVDSNEDNQFDIGESFTDLSEPFADFNEDKIFNGKTSDGQPFPGASDPSIVDPSLDAYDGRCYQDQSIYCYQVGGDNEEFIDSNNNGEFDLGNNLYNGLSCSIEDGASNNCSRNLVDLWKELTLLQAGSTANIGIIEQKLENDNSGNYFLTASLPATFDAHISDLHNGSLPNGTLISFEARNGTIIGPSSCEVLNSSVYRTNRCSVTIIPDSSSSTGLLIVTIETPSGILSTAAITLID